MNGSPANTGSTFPVSGSVHQTLHAVLVDGFVRGTWTITRQRDTATLRIEPFAALPTQDRIAVSEEGAGLLTFAAADAHAHDVQFVAPADGVYQARIYDIGFEGLQDHIYRLTLSSDSHVTRIYPLGGRRGDNRIAATPQRQTG